jgi:hypothetical protein
VLKAGSRLLGPCPPLVVLRRCWRIKTVCSALCQGLLETAIRTAISTATTATKLPLFGLRLATVRYFCWKPGGNKKALKPVISQLLRLFLMAEDGGLEPPSRYRQRFSRPHLRRFWCKFHGFFGKSATGRCHKLFIGGRFPLYEYLFRVTMIITVDHCD